MKYCTKCGSNLVDGARFCNACGAPAEVNAAQPANPDNPYTSSQPVYEVQPAPVYANEPKTDEQLRAEEQELLNKFNIGLKHERMTWKFVGIFYLIATIVIFICALFLGIEAVALDDYSGEMSYVLSTMASAYIGMAVCYIPVTIVNLVMKSKIEGYRAKLYTDCKDGIDHFSVGSIVFAAIFNTVALVFIIIYFVQAKNNSAVIERIKSQQDSYNSQL